MQTLPVLNPWAIHLLLQEYRDRSPRHIHHQQDARAGARGHALGFEAGIYYCESGV